MYKLIVQSIAINDKFIFDLNPGRIGHRNGVKKAIGESIPAVSIKFIWF